MDRISIFGYEVMSKAINSIGVGYTRQQINMSYKMTKPRLYIADEYFNCRLERIMEGYENYVYRGSNILFPAGKFEMLSGYVGEKDYGLVLKSHTPGTSLLLHEVTLSTIIGHTLRRSQCQDLIKRIIMELKSNVVSIPLAIYESVATYLYRNFTEIVAYYLVPKQEISNYNCTIVDVTIDKESLEGYDIKVLLDFYVKLAKLLSALSSGIVSYKNEYNDRLSLALEVKKDYYVLIPVFVEDYDNRFTVFDIVQMINNL